MEGMMEGVTNGAFIIFVGFICIIALVSLITLAGVFLGGFLVYKTRYSGKALLDKKVHVESGEAFQAQDDYPLEEDLMESASVDEASEDSRVDKALNNILSRNMTFQNQMNGGK